MKNVILDFNKANKLETQKNFLRKIMDYILESHSNKTEAFNTIFETLTKLNSSKLIGDLEFINIVNENLIKNEILKAEDILLKNVVLADVLLPSIEFNKYIEFSGINTDEPYPLPHPVRSDETITIPVVTLESQLAQKNLVQQGAFYLLNGVTNFVKGVDNLVNSNLNPIPSTSSDRGSRATDTTSSLSNVASNTEDGKLKFINQREALPPTLYSDSIVTISGIFDKNNYSNVNNVEKLLSKCTFDKINPAIKHNAGGSGNNMLSVAIYHNSSSKVIKNILNHKHNEKYCFSPFDLVQVNLNDVYIPSAKIYEANGYKKELCHRVTIYELLKYRIKNSINVENSKKCLKVIKKAWLKRVDEALFNDNKDQLSSLKDQLSPLLDKEFLKDFFSDRDFENSDLRSGFETILKSGMIDIDDVKKVISETDYKNEEGNSKIPTLLKFIEENEHIENNLNQPLNSTNNSEEDKILNIPLDPNTETETSLTGSSDLNSDSGLN